MLSRVKLSILVLCLYLVGCGSTTPLLQKPVNLERKKLSVKVLEVYEDEEMKLSSGFNSRVVKWTPPDGSRFVFVRIGMKNKTKKEIIIPMENAILSKGNKGKANLRWILNDYKSTSIKAHPNVRYYPDIDIVRILVFVYPKKMMPNTIHIRDIGKIKLNLKRPKKS